MFRPILRPLAAVPSRSLGAGRFRLGALLASAALLWAPAAAAGPGKRPAGAPPAQVLQAHASQAPASDGVSLGPEAALRAVALVGVPYRWGGSLPATGLDCSGLVHHVFGEIGVSTPRDTRGLSRVGHSVARGRLQAGDLVFFNTLRRAYSHVGIYLGDGRFVHAPSAGSEVRIESMENSYWRSRYNGARRLAPPDNEVAPAPAEATRVAASMRPGSPEPRATRPDSEADAADRAAARPADRPDARARAEEIASYYRY